MSTREKVYFVYCLAITKYVILLIKNKKIKQSINLTQSSQMRKIICIFQWQCLSIILIGVWFEKKLPHLKRDYLKGKPAKIENYYPL